MAAAGRSLARRLERPRPRGGRRVPGARGASGGALAAGRRGGGASRARRTGGPEIRPARRAVGAGEKTRHCRRGDRRPCELRCAGACLRRQRATHGVPRPSRLSARRCGPARAGRKRRRDRKSTRLNSSHLVISYAVFCLKKKKKKKKDLITNKKKKKKK